MNARQKTADSPLVSVVIPAYNAQAYIERTISSVLAQTYENLEVLVIDDGSKDSTAEIVADIARKDRRVILIQKTNGGVAAARNLGIEKSSGEFIAPIDADDIWYPQNIEKQVQAMLQGGDSVGLVYSWSIDIDEDDIPTGEFRASRIEGKVYTTLIFHDFIGNASSTLIKRDCLEKVGGYKSKLPSLDNRDSEDTDFYLRSQDWELYLRIAEQYQFKVVQEFLVGYRKLPDSMSGDYTLAAKSRYLIWQSIQQKYPNIPSAVYRLSSSSFYMNLAHKSSRYSRYKTTLFWIYKALQTDFITPCLRLGLYTMSIKSILGLVTEPLTSRIWGNNNPRLQSKQKSSSSKKTAPSFDPRNKPIKTNFKALAEIALHRLAPIIFGTPKTWKKQLS